MLRRLRSLRFDTLALLFFAGLAAQTATAQSLSVTNQTRPSQSDFWVGDQWLIQISGGAPNTTVTVCGVRNGISYGCTPFGSTDGSGYYQISSSMSVNEIGAWTETWYVGSTAATPSLGFNVYNSCNGSISQYQSFASLISYDYYDHNNSSPSPDFQTLGYDQDGASVATGACTFYTWFETNSPSAISTSTWAQSSTSIDLLAQDNGGGLFGARNRSNVFYPLSDYDDIEFVFVDSGGMYFYAYDYFLLQVYRSDY